MNRNDIIDLAKREVLFRGPDMILEFTDEILIQLEEFRGKSAEELRNDDNFLAMRVEVRKQARRVYKFLGYIPADDL